VVPLRFLDGLKVGGPGGPRGGQEGGVVAFTLRGVERRRDGGVFFFFFFSFFFLYHMFVDF